MTKLDALIDCKGIMEELGVKRASAERTMRDLQKFRIGRKVYVRRADVERWLQEQSAA
jgi:hypothetical protein